MRNRRTAILVDGSNNYVATKVLKFAMDFDKLIRLDEFGEVVYAYYFTALPDKSVESPIRKMTDHLEYNGWSVIQKPTKEVERYADGRSRLKGNMDIELALAAVEVAEHVTDIALFSGDGDFKAVVAYVQRKFAVRVTAFSTLFTDERNTSPIMADELRRQVNEFKDLEKYKHALMRPSRDEKPVIMPAQHGPGGFLKRRNAA